MFNKTRMVATLALAISTNCWGYSNEFYIGIGTGPETADFKQDARIINNLGMFTAFDAVDKTHHAGKGWFGSAFAGIGFRFKPCCDSKCENLYLGIEGNMDQRSLRWKLENFEFIRQNYNFTKYEMTSDYGVSLLPGLFLTDSTLFYVRIAHTKGQFKVLTTDTSLRNHLHKTLNGFRYGLGMRHNVSDCWALRLDYSQTTYKHAKMFTFDRGSFVSKHTSVTPRTSKFELGLMYMF